MKTRQITMTLAVGALAAAFHLNLRAAEPFLSPRAKESQVRRTRGVTEEKLDRAKLFKHGADSAFHPTVKGTGNNRDLVREWRNITVSPRLAETFPHLATGARRSPDEVARVR